MALLRKVIHEIRHPMGLRHPVVLQRGRTLLFCYTHIYSTYILCHYLLIFRFLLPISAMCFFFLTYANVFFNTLTNLVHGVLLLAQGRKLLFCYMYIYTTYTKFPLLLQEYPPYTNVYTSTSTHQYLLWVILWCCCCTEIAPFRFTT